MLKRRERVPDELSFLSPDEWKHLVGVVDPIVRRHRGSRAGSVVHFQADHVVNLGNLARSVRTLDRQEWEAEAQRFFDHFTDPLDPLATIRADPIAARAMLRVRPYPAEAFADVPIAAVTRPLAGELVDALCLDFPDRVAIVNEEMGEALGGHVDALFDTGFANVRAEGPPSLLDRIDVGEGVGLDVYVGDSYYAATWGRWPELLDDLGDHGALVAMPFRHQVLLHPLRTGRGAIIAPGQMLLLAHLGVSDGVGPISPQLFWWRGGRLSHLAGWVDDDGVHVAPSDEYVGVVELLAGT